MMRMGGNNVELLITCHVCEQKQPVIVVKHESLMYWVRGGKAQAAFPYLHPAERELLISGTCERCFDEMFASDE